MAQMKETYQKSVAPALKETLEKKHIRAVPRVEKVIVNSGLGRIIQSASNANDLLNSIAQEIALITGQKPIITRAKKSVASFKVRQGQPLGLKVTLRGERMYDFLERLIHLALPRSRDFKGIPLSAVDQNGNLTIGIREQIIFPETATSNKLFGLEVTVVTSASDKKEAIALFRNLGFPLQTED